MTSERDDMTPLEWANRVLAERARREPTEGLDVSFGMYDDLYTAMGEKKSVAWDAKKPITPESCSYPNRKAVLEKYLTWCPNAQYYEDDQSGTMFIVQPLKEGGEMIYSIDSFADVGSIRGRDALPVSSAIFQANGRQFVITEDPHFGAMPLCLVAIEKDASRKTTANDPVMGPVVELFDSDSESFGQAGESILFGAFGDMNGLFMLLHEWGHLVDPMNPRNTEAYVEGLVGDFPEGKGIFSEKATAMAYAIKILQENTADANAEQLLNALIDRGMVRAGMIEKFKRNVELASGTHRAGYMNPYDVAEMDAERHPSIDDPTKLVLWQEIVSTGRAFIRLLPPETIERAKASAEGVVLIEKDGYPMSLTPIGQPYKERRIIVSSGPGLKSLSAVIYDGSRKVARYLINPAGIRKEYLYNGKMRIDSVVVESQGDLDKGNIKMGNDILTELSLLLQHCVG